LTYAALRAWHRCHGNAAQQHALSVRATTHYTTWRAYKRGKYYYLVLPRGRIHSAPPAPLAWKLRHDSSRCGMALIYGALWAAAGHNLIACTGGLVAHRNIKRQAKKGVKVDEDSRYLCKGVAGGRRKGAE